MVLRELIHQKKILDKKILELQKMLEYMPNDDIASELIAFIERRQSKLISIDVANRRARLNIGGQEVDVATAVKIRDTLELKINTLTKIINSDNDYALDRIELMKQRDNFYNDYIILDNAILQSDLNTKVGG